MMKKFRSILAVCTALLVALTFAACGRKPSSEGGGGSTETYVDPNTETAYYDNKAFNEYLMGDDTTIAGQWPGYGIGDPFVMRYNGMYYLYVSTLDSETGVRAYKSADLIHWAQCTGEGLDTGYVSQDPVTAAAYAPEVYYFNGTFYMYTSPAGNGHYVLTSASPEGPFVKATDNFGLSIDGSVLIDDDETMYFTYASDAGIHMQKMTSPTEVTTGPNLNNTSIGGWTEGSYILKKDGVYYLTYTGTHVASDGYRIAYATADSLTTTAGSVNRNAFTSGMGNPLALSTESALKGIGHSSTVLGPDMDSYYLAYHMLNSSGGPNRSLGIDRLLFNGKQMSVAPRLTGSVTPKTPAFYATGLDAAKFDVSDAAALSKQTAGKDFTAEFNFAGSADAKLAFGYTDENNYSYVKVDFTEKLIRLVSVTAGAERTVAEGTLVNDFSALDNHTVRVASSGGVVDVVFDNMTKIDGASLTPGAGKIGYLGLTDLTAGYTAFSNTAMGMSDTAEVKAAEANIGASLYLRDDRYAEAAVLGDSSGVSTIEDGTLAGVKMLTLGAKNDRASYLADFAADGTYALEMVYPKDSGGKKIGIRFDTGDIYMVTLPKVETSEDYVKAIVTELDVTKGARVVRIENVGESAVSFVSFRFTASSKITPSYTASLENYATTGADYKTIWKLKDGGHYAKAAQRQLVYFGDDTITDFTMQVEMKLEGSSGTSTAGLVFHARNYASSSHDNYQSIQGYYLGFNNSSAVLERLNFADNSVSLATEVKNNPFKESDVFVTIKIQVRGNRITVWAGDAKLLDYTDNWAFTSGKLGLYTNGAAVVYRNLVVTA